VTALINMRAEPTSGLARKHEVMERHAERLIAKRT
jgi:hypothetical protein